MKPLSPEKKQAWERFIKGNRYNDDHFSKKGKRVREVTVKVAPLTNSLPVE